MPKPLTASLLIASWLGTLALLARAGVVVPLTAAEPTFILWQLPNQTRSQMMSYVIKTTNRKLIVIDGGTAGDAEYLRSFLAEQGTDVEAWFVSHAHEDHTGALTQLLGAADRPRIHTIYGSLPTLEWVTKVGRGERDVQPYTQLLEAVRKAGKSVVDLQQGQELTIDGVRIEVLGVRNPEITVNGINNSSLVLRVSDRSKSVLFLGDLGAEGGRKLLNSPFRSRLASTYVQMAHHGQDGVDEAFYKAAKPRFCLWPTPRWLWDNDSGAGKGSGRWKTLEVRAWMDTLHIERQYVMADGLARID